MAKQQQASDPERMAFLALLSMCKATVTTIEYRGKLALASYDALATDESNWRDGVEPYLLDLYDQCVNAVSHAEECEQVRRLTKAFNSAPDNLVL